MEDIEEVSDELRSLYEDLDTLRSANASLRLELIKNTRHVCEDPNKKALIALEIVWSAVAALDDRWSGSTHHAFQDCREQVLALVYNLKEGNTDG